MCSFCEKHRALGAILFHTNGIILETCGSNAVSMTSSARSSNDISFEDRSNAQLKDSRTAHQPNATGCTALTFQAWHSLIPCRSPTLPLVESKEWSGPHNDRAYAGAKDRGVPVRNQILKSALQFTSVNIERAGRSLQNASDRIQLPLARALYARKVIHHEALDQDYAMIIPSLSGNSTSLVGSSLQGHDRIDLSSFMCNLPAYAESIIDRASPVDLVNQMFPPSIALPGARYVAACFWSWLCVLDGK